MSFVRGMPNKGSCGWYGLVVGVRVVFSARGPSIAGCFPTVSAPITLFHTSLCPLTDVWPAEATTNRNWGDFVWGAVLAGAVSVVDCVVIDDLMYWCGSVSPFPRCTVGMGH